MVTSHKRGLQQALTEAVRRAERNYKEEHPEALGLRIKANIATYKPRSKEVRDVPVMAVAKFVYEPASMTRSNAQLAIELGREIGYKVPPNILTERFTTKQAVRVKEILDGRKIVLDLSLHDTPSKVKKALKARGTKQSAELGCAVSVAFSADAVTVDDRVYPIQTGGGVRRIHVGKSKLNVDVLKALICP